MKITKEWLRENNACPKGIVWFVDNYPNGLKITKTGINRLFSRLNKRDTGFERGNIKTNHFKRDVKYDTLRTMHWLLDCLVQDEQEFLNLDWESRITQKEAFNVWWGLYINGEPL